MDEKKKLHTTICSWSASSITSAYAMGIKGFTLLFIFILISPAPVKCWDSVQLEVFDVVEEVNQNFYELMKISQEATVSDVKKAYRSLSKVIHPDKSDAPDADIQFRQLVAVYEVLRDSERRALYDKVLVEGLPDWRSAVYYYRKARKMSLLEATIILTIVISIAQYFMAWGTYWDRYKTMDEALARKYRTRSKQKKKAPTAEAEPVYSIEDELATIPRPSPWNILPIQFCRASYFLVRYGPSLVRHWRDERKREEEERLEKIKEEEQMLLDEENKAAERKARKANSRRRVRVVPEMDPDEINQRANAEDASSHTAYQEPAAAGYATGMWTSEEFCELSKLMNKFPGGTVDRWDVISEHLNRAPHEVTKMAVKMREKLAAGAWLQEQEETMQTKIKVKTRATEADSTSGDAHWNAVQQKALEKSLKAHPKGTDQRWEKIAKQVPEKTAEECINRFKFLADRIRKKKEEEVAAAELATQRDPGWRGEPTPAGEQGEGNTDTEQDDEESDASSNR